MQLVHLRNSGLDEPQAGSKIAGRNINNFRYAGDATLMAESEEKLKSLLRRMKEESEKAGLKHNIHKTKIMASGPITSWQIDGEKVERVADFIFLGSKIIADNDGNHEIKRCLLLGRKIMANLDSVLKSRNITLLTKVHLVKAMGFPIVMYRYESRTIKKAECQRINAFKLWCWRRLLRVPWTARRSNQWILKEISPEYSLEGLMLKQKLQYFWPPDAKSQLIGKDPDAGKDWGLEKWVTEDETVQWYHWLNGYEFGQTSWDSEGQGSLMLQSMGLPRVRHDGATQQQGVQPSYQYSGDKHFPLVPCGDIFLVPIPVLTSAF